MSLISRYIAYGWVELSVPIHLPGVASPSSCAMPAAGKVCTTRRGRGGQCKWAVLHRLPARRGGATGWLPVHLASPSVTLKGCACCRLTWPSFPPPNHPPLTAVVCRIDFNATTVHSRSQLPAVPADSRPAATERVFKYGPGGLFGELDFFLQRPRRWVARAVPSHVLARAGTNLHPLQLNTYLSPRAAHSHCHPAAASQQKPPVTAAPGASTAAPLSAWRLKTPPLWCCWRRLCCAPPASARRTPWRHWSAAAAPTERRE